MAGKTKNTNDDRKAKGRFMDQPGQWVNKTPKSVMKRRSKGLAELAKELNGGKTKTTGKRGKK